jgi:hypothetical protein
MSINKINFVVLVIHKHKLAKVHIIASTKINIIPTFQIYLLSHTPF